MSTTPPLPPLQTLHTKPTWHNRAGRVDRSACFVLNASKLWREIPEEEWTYRLGLGPEARGLCRSTPQASRLKPHHFGKPDRTADLTLWARDLWELHRWEQPYPLQGDFRTAKSNALRCQGLRPEARGLSQRSPQAPSHKPQDPVNPNRGVGFNFHKRLGLPADWSATLTICRIVQHAKLRQHFFICPVCGNNKNSEAAATLRVAGQTTRPTGRRPTAIASKLYLPLCTEREHEDARFAQLWLKTNLHPNRPLTPQALQLIERYSELFEPRTLRCRHCLGLRYGEVKPPRHHAGAKRSTQPPAHSRADQQRHPVRPGMARRLPEQSLFLTNLPKLLAKPTTHPNHQSKSINHQSTPTPPAAPQSSITNQKSSITHLPAELREKLLHLLFQQTPSYKALEQAKQERP